MEPSAAISQGRRKATSPTATVLLESILERKWQHPAIYAIVCLMVVGPVLAQFGSTLGDADPVGIVMMVLAVISGAFKYVLAHKVIKEYRHSMGTLAFTFWVEVIVGVVLLLFKKGHYGSSYMLVTLERLAAKFGDVKFLKIVSTECIPGYPDRNLPTLLVYKDDDMLAQWVGTKMFGGAQYSADDVEWELAQLGVLATELAKNPHAELTPFVVEARGRLGAGGSW